MTDSVSIRYNVGNSKVFYTEWKHGTDTRPRNWTPENQTTPDQGSRSDK